MPDVVVLTRRELTDIIRDASRDAALETRNALVGAVNVSPPAWLYKEWVTTLEATHMLGVSDPDTVRKLRGKIDSRKRGRDLLWRRESILEYIEGLEE